MVLGKLNRPVKDWAELLGYRASDNIVDRTKYDSTPAGDQLTPALIKMLSIKTEKKPMAFQIGPTISDSKGNLLAVPLAVDVKDFETMYHGLINRSLKKTPQPKQKSVQNFARYVRRELVTFHTQVGNAEAMPFDEWIVTRNYPQHKKQKYIRAHANVLSGLLRRKNCRISGFVKREFYPTPKPARMIHSRDLEMSSHWGPYCTAIEKKVFHHPWGQQHTPFLKYTTFTDRPTVIDENFNIFEHDVCYKTDYSKFENSFRKCLIKICENALYKKFFPDHPVVKTVCQVLADEQKCQTMGYNYVVPEGRMSGDMNTSLGNGFTNLMLTRYFMHRLGLKCVQFVEGDDCLFKPERPLTPKEKELIFQWATDLGFTLTLEHEGPCHSAGFCSTYWSPSNRKCFIQPFKPLLQLGWSFQAHRHSTTEERRALLKAKCMSYLSQSPDCPILAPICYKIYRSLHKTKAKMKYDSYVYDRLVSDGLNPTVRKNWIYIHDSGKFREPDINYQDRVDFADIFMCCPTEQREIEQSSNIHHISPSLVRHLPWESSEYASLLGRRAGRA
jgi:hypothetical protein